MGLTESKNEKVLKNFTKKEVDDLARQGRCVFLMDSQIYDVTDFLYEHPGGCDVLEDVNAKDAKSEFEAAGHSALAIEQTEEYLIGSLNENEMQVEVEKKRIVILFGTQFGTSKKFAGKMFRSIEGKYEIDVSINSFGGFDPEDLNNETLLLCVLSTVEGGNPPANAEFFCNWINEAVNDWRVHDSYLDKLRFAVFGCCNSLYEQNCNLAGIKLFENLVKIGAHPLLELGVGDKNIQRQDSSTATQATDFDDWLLRLLPEVSKAVLEPRYYPKKILMPGVFEKKKEISKPQPQTSNHSDLMDIEALGNVVNPTKKSADNEENVEREMITPVMREKLTKEGYKLLGSHSAVKLCRWTKAMLRGRGGCYKHTFYGIISYRCMESTPNLACANRCVFCWRHHTNPVGKEWRWVTDPPQMILEEALSQHYKMIKTMQGAPGVSKQRFSEAHKVKHCALSLVGEPIMYPHIQEYINLLHEKGISSFMVTNAQFPEKIKTLGPVTQFYISIDASTKESLKSVDRPLFQDFWERFLASMDALKFKQQRTVYRLTLVKSWNMQEVADYAALVARGMPSFIEIKGVTFCGKSDGYAMKMDNVPWHEEVRHFCEKLVSYLSDDYELACEHRHSCCVLIARKEYKIDGKWHTWIDFDKFISLVGSGKSFTELDYMAPTPDWAVWGAPEEGFNPKHEWTRRVRKLRERAQNSLNRALTGIEESKENFQEPSLEANTYLLAKEKIRTSI